MFKELENNLQGVEAQEDRLGGQYTVESGVYPGKVKVAYLTDSSRSKSKCVISVIELEDGFELTSRTWIFNGNGEPTYERDGKKRMLPGYELINDMHLCTTGLPLTEGTVEDKVIKVWDNEAKAERDQNMPVITSMLGKPITVAVLRTIENKQEKNDATGEYVDTNEERTVNELNKVFHTETGKTVVELQKKVDLPREEMFISKWAEKNTGKDRNKFKEVTGAAGGTPGGGSGAPNSGGAAKSLFN